MPKKIQNKVSKHKSPHSKFKIKLVHLLLIIIPLALWFGYRQLVISPEVYEVAEAGRVQVYSSTAPEQRWSPSTPPANCISWFDGCNRCTVKNGVIAGCTMMACKTSTQPPRCLEYLGGATPDPVPSVDKITPSPIPSNCTYESVKCIKEPCPRILTCKPTPSASATPMPSGCYSIMEPCASGRMCAQVMKTICPTPNPSLSASSISSPISSGTYCIQKISSITFKEPCGSQGFRSATYQCDGGEVKTYSDSCMDVPAIYDKIRGLCGDTCTTTTAPAKF